MQQFKLSEQFIEQYKGKQPNWGYGTFSYIVYKRTYSRIKEDGTNEEFWETLKRVIEGCFSVQKQHCQHFKLPWNNKRAQKSAQIMFEKMWNFKFLPPGRGLWAMGTDIIAKKGSGALFNCSYISTEYIDEDFSKPFINALDYLCLGIGVGYCLRGANKTLIKQPILGNKEFIIPDTREGWMEALRILLNAFVGIGEIPVFNYSEIRPAGAPIKTFGGVSSGHEPLKLLLTDVQTLLLKRVGQKITSVDIVDIMDMIGRAIVSGNVRRSALIALGEATDLEFINCKNPKKYPNELDGWRWASNNSIFVTEDTEYNNIVSHTIENGEPAFVFLQNCRLYGRMKDQPDYKDIKIGGLNPCGEITLEDMEFCNLSDIFINKHDSLEEFLDTIKYAYLYCKTVTLIPSHNETTNQRILKNRRIGISLSGIEQAKQKFGYRIFYNEFCEKGYQTLKKWDSIYSDWLCVPRSIKLSTVKPNGTTSLLVGATPGVHAAHAEYYYRTMRLAHNSPLIPQLIKAGYRVEYGATEWKEGYYCSHNWKDSNNSIMSGECAIAKHWWKEFILNNHVRINGDTFNIPNFTGTMVVYFPVKEDNFTKGKNEQSIWEQTENAAKMQYYWSDNAVSVTVTFKTEEEREILPILESYENRLKTISFLPLKDHGYLQAPYITITKDEYEKAIKNIKSFNIQDILSQDKKEDKYCDGDKCAI